MISYELVIAFIAIFFVILIGIEIRQRSKPAYLAATKIKGKTIYPIIGNALDLIGLGEPGNRYEILF